MQRSSNIPDHFVRKAGAEGAVVLVFLVAWLIPSAATFLQHYKSIVAAVIYGATYGVVMNNLAIRLRLKHSLVVGLGVGLSFGLGAAVVADIFLSADAWLTTTGFVSTTISSVAPTLLLTLALIPGLAGGVGMGFFLGRMDKWKILAVGGSSVIALCGIFGSWLYTPTLIWAASGSAMCFGLLCALTVTVAFLGEINTRALVLYYALPAGLSGTIASMLILLDRQGHIANDVASTAPWFLLISLAIGAGGSATLYFGQYIGSLLRQVGTSSIQDIAVPLGDIKNYIRPLITFMSVYVLIAVWFGLWYYAIDRLLIPRSFLIQRVHVTGPVDMFGYASATEAIYYSFVTITTLGYGDIVPVRAWSKCSSIAEVIVGTSWLVVYFAFLFAKLRTLTSDGTHVGSVEVEIRPIGEIK